MNIASLTPLDYWDIALRRKWLIMASIILCVAVALVLCKVLPKSYRSRTLILVENQKIPERYVQGVVSGTVRERLTMIKQQVLSRTVLSGVIEEFGLHRKGNNEVLLDTAIARMRDNVDVEIKGNQQNVDAFSISFAHEDPRTAMKVTSRLASRFMEENLKQREQFVEGAGQFLDLELARAKAELEDKERQISKFKSEHIGELPQQIEPNLRALDRLQRELMGLQESEQRLTERLAAVDTAVREYQVTGKASTQLSQEQTGPVQLFKKLKDLKSKLASLSAEYKETYPDIVLTKQEIEALKKQIEQEYGGRTDVDTTAPMDPYLRQLSSERDVVTRDLASLKRRKRQLESEKKEYEKRVEAAPALEQELLILMRDYDNMRRNYGALLDKRLNARVAENLERRQKGEQFRVLDPANLPRVPEEPDPQRILLLGLGIGCALGFGSSLGLELLRRPYRRSEEIEEQLGLHILAAIPEFRFAYDMPRKARSLVGMRTGLKAGQRRGASQEHQAGEGGPSGNQRGPGKSEADRVEGSLVAKLRPRSVVAEQYRVVASQLSLLEAGRASSVIVITSSVKGEGKSTTAINLGYTLARDLGRRTLLVDCDLKCPALHEYVSVPQEPGLTDVLHAGVPLDNCLHQIDGIEFWVLPVGRRGKGSTDLPKIQQIAELFGELTSRFEYILVDAPPILPLADMNVLTRLGDVLVLVVQAAVTPQHVVHRSLKTWKPPTQPHVILNGVEPNALPYYMHYDYERRAAKVSSS